MREETWQSGAASGKYCVHEKVVFSGTQNLRRWWGSDCCLLSLKYLKHRNQVGKEGWKNSLLYYMETVFLRNAWKVFLWGPGAQTDCFWLYQLAVITALKTKALLTSEPPIWKGEDIGECVNPIPPLKKDELKTSSHLQSQNTISFFGSQDTDIFRYLNCTNTHLQTQKRINQPT